MKWNHDFSRRKLIERALGATALGSAFKFVDRPANGQPIQAGGVNRNSAPSQLKITDMRAIRIASNYDYPIIRIDTNQGVYGLGEVRDAGMEGMALILKPHIMGRNPLQIEPILDSVRNFTNQRRFGGGYSALDMALHDIAGKVYGVPCWRLIGSQVPRPDPHLLRHGPDQGCEGLRRPAGAAQEDGLHLLQDGPGDLAGARTSRAR